MLEEDIDSMLMDEMDDDDVMSRLREERMMQLKHQFVTTLHPLLIHDTLDRNIQHSNMEQKGHGIYTEAQNDKQVLDETTGTLCCVVHFYKKEFKRCLIVDKHLKVSINLFIHSSHLLGLATTSLLDLIFSTAMTSWYVTPFFHATLCSNSISHSIVSSSSFGLSRFWLQNISTPNSSKLKWTTLRF